MTARCTQCGHENNPEYRFCGVCGAPLPAEAPSREPVREAERGRVSAVGGPSFLGLGDDRTNDLDYLLEEEPQRGHGRMYLALLLLLMSAGLLAWHWQRDGYPWAGLGQFSAGGKGTANSSTNSGQAAAAPSVTPDPAGTQAATNPAGADSVQAAAPPGENPSPNPITVVKPPEQATDSTDGGDGSATKAPAAGIQDPGTGFSPATPEKAAPTQASNQAPNQVPNQAPNQRTSEQATPEQESQGQETPGLESPATPVRKPAVVKPVPAVPAAPLPSPEDRLVDEGERYLYGRGVRADCALAQRNLMIGARASNPKAQTLLGAMYATGHCVGRDLPTAYRWFAKALHGDPGNSRVQRDLEVLWKQMTPEERQIAMKSQ
jgi:hypothetical protein